MYTIDETTRRTRTELTAQASPDARSRPYDRTTSDTRAFDRPRLLAQLRAFRQSDQRLLTIWAAAGAGKSTLLAQWAAALAEDGLTARWLTSADLSPTNHPDATSASTSTSTSIVNSEEWLVIDDVDSLLDGRGVAPLVRLVASLPPRTRLVIAGRYEPSGFAEVTLAAAGRVVIPNRDLAFTVQETIELACSFGLPLAVSEAESLAERTDGWAAGLALAMPYLAAQSDPVAAIAQFDGDQHQVADYLLVRVLDALDEHDRDVLMRTAVAVHVPLDLAVTLTRRRDAGSVLRRLSARNVLVDSDRSGDGFRFHPILTSYMRAELRRRDELVAIQNHMLAAEWYELHGDHDAAVQQALLSRDLGVIAHQLERSGAALLMQGRSATVTTALRALANRQDTLAIAVLRLGMDIPSFPDRIGSREQLAEAKRLLSTATPASARRWRPMVHAIEAFMVDDPDEATVQLRVLGDFMRATPIESLDAALAIRSAIASLLATSGNRADAESLLRSLQATALRAGYTWVYLIAAEALAGLAASVGDWRSATVYEQRMGAVSFDTSPPYNRATARTMLITTAYAYARCEPVSFASVHQIHAADPTGTDLGLLLQARSLLLIAALDASPAPREALSQLVQLVRTDGRDHPRVVATVSTRLFTWSHALHGPHAAADVRQLVVAILGPDSLEARTLRLLAAGRNDYLAERALAEVLDEDRSAWTGSSVVIGHLVLASRAKDDGRRSETTERLRRALEVAEEFGYAREFLANRGFGAQLVHEARGSFGPLEAYATHVLDLAAAARIPLGVERADTMVALTPKEQELLLELPAHQTVAEIAAKHHLSANTIKTHLRSIYTKLDAGGRTEAVAVARQHGLL